MEEKIMFISAEIQANNKEEAGAIEKYSVLIQNIIDSELTDEEKEFAINSIKEIISDELNHQKKLQELYTYITGIETNAN